MGRNRIKGGRQREKEREGERELGEGLMAREEGSREEKAEGREETQAEVLRHNAARSGKRREPPIQGTRQQSPSRSQVPK